MSQQQPILVRRWDGGWVTELASDELDVSMSPDMENANYDKGGSVRKDAGFDEIGSDSDDENIAALIVLSNRQADNEWLFKISGENIKLYDSQNDIFTVVEPGVTAGLSWGHIVFNNILHLGNRVNSAMSFDLGLITRLDGAIANGATEIDLVDASQFAAAGAVHINGVLVAYTGKTDNKLTGCTNAVATPDNYLVTGTFSHHGSVPRGDVYEEYAGRLVIANVPGSGASTVYGSKATDRTNFNIAGGGATDDAFAMAFPAKVNSIRGFRDDTGTSRLMVFLADNAIEALGIDDDAGLGTLTYRRPFKSGVTALNHATNIPGTNDIFHVDIDNQVRTLGSTYANRGIDNVFSDSISKVHKTFFKEKCDFSISRAIIFNDQYWVAAKQDSRGDYNNVIFIYDLARKAWRRRTGVNVAAMGIYDNKVIFADAILNKVYSFSMDSMSDNGAYLRFKYSTPDFDWNPLAFERLRSFRQSGIMSSNCVITADVYRDFGTVKIGSFEIRGNNPDIMGSILGEAGTFGHVAFGEEVAGGEPGLNRRFFVAHLELKNLPDFENFRIVFTNNQSGVYLELSKLKPFILPQDEHYFDQKYMIATTS